MSLGPLGPGTKAPSLQPLLKLACKWIVQTRDGAVERRRARARQREPRRVSECMRVCVAGKHQWGCQICMSGCLCQWAHWEGCLAGGASPTRSGKRLAERLSQQTKHLTVARRCSGRRARTEKRGVKRAETYTHTHTELVQVFARAYTRVCMCACSKRRPAWFAAPNSLRCLHRGVPPPPHIYSTFGSQCGFFVRLAQSGSSAG